MAIEDLVTANLIYNKYTQMYTSVTAISVRPPVRELSYP